ncbi:MAG: hypothetical protein DRJ10_04040 [Bacteroidetes bacterium]|nr:MAG: hypothetical protein DRJ10_04040 [Bacteroidota bacterium]
METNNIKLAQAIDFINKWIIDYYTRENNSDPDPYIIQSELYKQKNIDHKYFDHAIRIMKYEGFVEYVSNDEKDVNIRALKHTPKGLTLFLNGGMEKKVKEKQNDKTLSQQQVQSVIKTNHHQRIVLYLTLSVALLTLSLQWRLFLSNNRNDLTPVIFGSHDTVDVRIINKTDSFEILKDTVMLE